MPNGKKKGGVPRETNRAERNYADRRSPKWYSEVRSTWYGIGNASLFGAVWVQPNIHS